MARKLKTYQTSLGFFDQAIAAPSMKAALEAWGADSNLFHQGAAKESHDPDVVAATMAKPGVVLKRPVGTDRPFGEHAELPTDLGGTGPRLLQIGGRDLVEAVVDLAGVDQIAAFAPADVEPVPLRTIEGETGNGQRLPLRASLLDRSATPAQNAPLTRMTGAEHRRQPTSGSTA